MRTYITLVTLKMQSFRWRYKMDYLHCFITCWFIWI